MLPGTILETAETNLNIPAFTAIGALLPGTASIIKTSRAHLLFSDNANQNEIRFSGLYLADTWGTVPTGGSTTIGSNTIPLTTY